MSVVRSSSCFDSAVCLGSAQALQSSVSVQRVCVSGRVCACECDCLQVERTHRCVGLGGLSNLCAHALQNIMTALQWCAYTEHICAPYGLVRIPPCVSCQGMMWGNQETGACFAWQYVF